MPFCRKCGLEYSEGDIFCEKCGAALRKVTDEKKHAGEEKQRVPIGEVRKPTQNQKRGACTYCGFEYTEEDSICSKCLRKIDRIGQPEKIYPEEKQKMPTEEVLKPTEKAIQDATEYLNEIEHEKKSAGSNTWIFIVLLLIIGSIIPIFPKQVSYQVNEPYETPIKYVVDNAYVQKEGLLDVWAYSYVITRNVDDTGGTFTVVHKLYTVDGFFGEKNQQAYIGPGQSYTFKGGFDIRAFQDVKGEYLVTPPTKTAYRVVTKYKTEQTSLIGLFS